jgi:O-antigen/teichoic acid export membrane protein
MSPAPASWLSRIASSETLVTGIGRGVAAVSNFALFWLLIRSLSPSEYAQLGLINGLQVFVANILLGPALLQIGRETWDWHHERALTERMSGALAGLGLISLVGNIGLALLATGVGWIRPDALPGVVLGAVLYLAWFFLSQVLNNAGVLRERRVFSTYLVLEGVAKVLVVLGLHLARAQAPAWFYFVAIQAAGLMGAWVAYRLHHGTLERYGLLLGRLWAAPGKLTRKNLRFIAGSRSLRATGIFNWGFSTGSRYVLEPLVSRSALGIFLAGWNLGTTVLGALDGLYSSVMIPVLYNRTAGRPDDRLERKGECGRYLGVLLALLLPLLVVFVVFARSLAQLLLSNQIGSPTSIVRAGLVAAACIMVTAAFQTFSLIERTPRPNALASGLIMVVGLSALALMTRKYGLEAGAWGLALGAFLGASAMLALAHGWVDWTVVREAIPRAAAGTVLTVGVAWAALAVVPLALPDWGRWTTFLAWIAPGLGWMSYVWWMVRPWAARQTPSVPH